jgi:alpha-L-fucosidase
MKLMMLVAKHHDGFCMWPSPYTDHDVETSPWQGDIVKEITEACKRHGLKFGFYLSPADLYQIENEKGVYGKNSEYVESVIPTPIPGAPKGPRTFTYTVDDYNRYFLNQLYELLTQYGEITEVWFDGANPKPGTGQEYNYADWYEMIHELQPGANIAIAGPDVRWCGNEAGRTRRSEWSVVPATVNEDGTWKGAGSTLDDLGSLGMLSKFEDMRWHPAETNTSIRHGWFWRDEKQYVKTTQEILDVWTRSVGGNTVFLLNLTPNDRGLISDRDVAVLKGVGEVLRETYATDLAQGAGGPGVLLDGDSETGWSTANWLTSGDVVLELDGEKTFSRVLLQEPIATSGQRVSKFYVDARVDGAWKQVGEGTTIGYKRILAIDPVTADAVRIRIRGSRVSAQLSTVSLHLAPVILTSPKLSRTRDGVLSMVCDPAGPAIHYTLDGSTPTAESALFEGSINMADGGHVRAVAVHPTTGEVSSEVSEVFGMATAGWKIASFSSEQADASEQAVNAIDGNPATIWHSQWKGEVPEHPHSIVIDLGGEKSVSGFTYLPRSNSLAGVFKKWKVEVSTDGTTYTTAGEGEFGNIKNNPIQQIVRFDQAVSGRYVKVICLESVDNAKWASAAELGLLGG